MDIKFNLEKVPNQGYILAYFRECVVFEKYEIKNGQINEDIFSSVDMNNLLECHFFNETIEYRLIMSRKRQVIESVIRKEDEKESEMFKEEQVLLENSFNQFGKILKIVNYLKFDENDMIQVINYRLAGIIE